MRILAIDLGKTKSVACIYETETCAAESEDPDLQSGNPKSDCFLSAEPRGD